VPWFETPLNLPLIRSMATRYTSWAGLYTDDQFTPASVVR
jgi:hypothetical protein